MRDTKALREARKQEQDPYRRRFPYRGWNRTVTVTDEPSLFRRLPEFDGWNQSLHLNRARDYAVAASLTERAYADAINESAKRYGDHGPLVSGVYRDHFPEPVKELLRCLAHRLSTDMDKSAAHWLAGRRTLPTWRAMLKETREGLQ